MKRHPTQTLYLFGFTAIVLAALPCRAQAQHWNGPANRFAEIRSTATFAEQEGQENIVVLGGTWRAAKLLDRDWGLVFSLPFMIDIENIGSVALGNPEFSLLRRIAGDSVHGPVRVWLRTGASVPLLTSMFADDTGAALYRSEIQSRGQFVRGSGSAHANVTSDFRARWFHGEAEVGTQWLRRNGEREWALVGRATGGIRKKRWLARATVASYCPLEFSRACDARAEVEVAYLGPANEAVSLSLFSTREPAEDWEDLFGLALQVSQPF